MKQTKGIYRDSDIRDQPSGYLYSVQNGLMTDTKGAIENEPGDEFLKDIPGTLVGMVPLNKKQTLVFYQNNIQNGIYLLEPNGDFSTVVINNLLGFNPNTPIVGEYYINFKEERIVVFIQDDKPVRILNVDRPNINSIEDFNLFPVTTFATPEVTVVTEQGNLQSGSYSIFYRQKNNDTGAITDWSQASKTLPISNVPNIIYEGSEGGEVSGDAISITIPVFTEGYTTVEFATVYSNNEQISAYIFGEFTILNANASQSFFLLGTETQQTILLEELLTRSLVIKNAKAITQLNNQLFLGNFELNQSNSFNYQLFANEIEIDWYTTDYPVANSKASDQRRFFAENKTFMPGEVYAFYIQLYIDGQWSKAFHIPGPDLTSTDRNTVTITGSGDFKAYQLIDTVTQLNAVSGRMGKWENENEVYSELYGPLLQNKKIRHHRFPTTRYLYTINSQFSAGINPKKTQTDTVLLGIKVRNVEIPSELAGRVTAYRILHARRGFQSSTTLGQSLLFFTGSQNNNPDSNYASCGNMETNADSNTDKIVKSSFFIRFHAFDQLVDKPTVRPNLLRIEHRFNAVDNKETRPDSNSLRSFRLPLALLASGNTLTSLSDFRYAHFDFSDTEYTEAELQTLKTNSAAIGISSNSVQNQIIPVRSRGYVPTGSIQSFDDFSYNNVAGEEHLVLENLNPQLFNTQLFDYQQEAEGEGLFIGGNPEIDGNDTTMVTGSHVVTLLNITENLYSPFEQQPLVILPETATENDLSAFATGILPERVFEGSINGDAFAGLYAIRLTGPLDVTAADSTDGVRNLEDGAENGEGCKATYLMPTCYSNLNLNAQYQESEDTQSLYYRVTDTPQVLINNIKTLYSGKQNITLPFKTLYNPDHTLRLNAELSSAEVYVQQDTENVNVKFPHTVARSLQQDTQSSDISWRTFLVNDIYTIPRNRGVISNLQALSNQRLFIHTTETLFLTRNRTVLSTSAADITLGSGGIFDIPPSEIVTDQGAYAGTIDRGSCTMTKVGYAFVNSVEGKIFLHTGETLDEISAKGMRKFFRNTINPLNSNRLTGAGSIITYDERFNRLLITYRSSDAFNTDYTLSYSMETDSFISFHSAHPIAYLTQPGLETIEVYRNPPSSFKWIRKNTGRIIGLYGAQSEQIDSPDIADFIRPLILEIVYNPEVYNSKYFAGLQWVTEIIDQDQTLIADKTWDRLQALSPTKLTGEIALTKFKASNNPYKANVRKTENTWKFNNLRNIKNKDVAIQINPEEGVSAFTNNVSTAPNTPWYRQARFVEQYMLVQYVYENADNHKFYFLNHELQARKSIR